MDDSAEQKVIFILIIYIMLSGYQLMVVSCSVFPVISLSRSC